MSRQLISEDKLRQIFFIIIVVLLGGVLFWQLYSFIPALLGAMTLYILMRRSLSYLTEIRKWKNIWAVLALMLMSIVIILLPIGILVNMLSSKISFAIQHSNELVAAIKKVTDHLEESFHVTLISDETLNKFGAAVTEMVPKILTATFDSLSAIFFTYFLLYFMLTNASEMEEALYELIPLNNRNTKKIRNRVENIVISNAIGIPVIAVIQGIVALIGYFILGVKEPWFWFVVTCITAMIPIVGAALAYVSIALIFFADHENAKGIILLIYGFGIVGTVDSIFRFMLQKKIGNIHPLITVFGVFAGIKLFGFIGLIFGPLLISMFILLLRIYSSEFIIPEKKQTNAVDGLET